MHTESKVEMTWLAYTNFSDKAASVKSTRLHFCSDGFFLPELSFSICTCSTLYIVDTSSVSVFFLHL